MRRDEGFDVGLQVCLTWCWALDSRRVGAADYDSNEEGEKDTMVKLTGVIVSRFGGGPRWG